MTAQRTAMADVERIIRRLYSVAYRLLPHAVARGFRASGEGPIWDGVYADFRDVPVEDDDYATPAHLDSIEESARAFLGAWRAGQELRLWHEGLALVAGCAAGKASTVTVVDFGGGLGTGYLHLKQRLAPDVRVHYIVVEIPELVARGRRLFAEIADVSFCGTLSDVSVRPNIVYVNSALQYVENYANLLRQIAAIIYLT